MQLSLSHRDPTPLYEQIVSEIRRKITSGELRSGEALPSIRQLAAELTTSVITTKRAYQELEQAGWIYTRPGMGSFVAEYTDTDQKQPARQELYSRLTAICLEAKQQGISVIELKSLLERVISEEGTW